MLAPPHTPHPPPFGLQFVAGSMGSGVAPQAPPAQEGSSRRSSSALNTGSDNTDASCSMCSGSSREEEDEAGGLEVGSKGDSGVAARRGEAGRMVAAGPGTHAPHMASLRLAAKQQRRVQQLLQRQQQGRGAAIVAAAHRTPRGVLMHPGGAQDVVSVVPEQRCVRACMCSLCVFWWMRCGHVCQCMGGEG